MGSDRGHGVGGIVCRVLKIIPAVPLEVKDPVGQNTPAGQLPADPGGHGAQVFADDQGPAAAAFQGQNSQHFPGRIMDISPGRGALAPGNPEEAEEPHDMVHPEQAPGGQIGPEGIDEQAVPVLAEALGNQGRQPPVLPPGIEGVRGRAQVRTLGEELGMGPGGRAVRVGPQCQVLIKAERQTLAFGLQLDPGQLPGHQPLAILLAVNLLPMLAAERRHRRALRVLIFPGPGMPNIVAQVIRQGVILPEAQKG